MSFGSFPEFVDAYQVFAHRARIAALVPLEKLQRFSQYLFNEQTLAQEKAEKPAIKVDLDFSRDVSGYRTVSGQISAVVTLKCQRCLQGLQHELELSPDLIVADSEEKASQVEDDREVVLTQMREEHRILDLLALVEDELILGLPLVPRHAEGECEALQIKPVNAPVSEKRSITGDNTEMHDKLLALKASLAKAGKSSGSEDSE